VCKAKPKRTPNARVAAAYERAVAEHYLTSDDFAQLALLFADQAGVSLRVQDTIAACLNTEPLEVQP
jgi:hypothetical protein